MSASDKKKLRKEQVDLQMTERQQQAQKEARKATFITVAFVATMVVIFLAVIATIVIPKVETAGFAEKRTVALTVGDHQINSVEMNYYYTDAINEQYSTWSNNYGDNMTDYVLSLEGLDMTKALDQQVKDEETGLTWAQYFVNTAIEDARRDYALADAAEKAGYTLSEDDRTIVDNIATNMSSYATMYGYSAADDYIRAMYGNGSSVKSYQEYYARGLLADSYVEEYKNNLSFTAEDLEKYVTDNGKENAYTAYNYSTVYVSYSNYLEMVTADQEAEPTDATEATETTDYTDEQMDAARLMASTKAMELAKAKNLEELQEAVDKLNEKDGTSLSVTNNDGTMTDSLQSDLKDWLTDPERKQGDMHAEPVLSVAEEGKEAKQNGYYIVYFDSVTDNNVAMSNVRHILIDVVCDVDTTTDTEHVHTDEEWAATEAKAQELLDAWKAGDATEDSFVALVAENTADTASAETGGLYENINPSSSYVDSFKSWALDSARQAGDTGLVKSDYGYHIMYFKGYSEKTYRSYMIENDLTDSTMTSWEEGLIQAMTVTNGSTKYLNMSVVLASS